MMDHRVYRCGFGLALVLLVWGAWGNSIPWDMEALSKPPATTPAPGFEAEGVRALFYEGVPYHGKPTRVFAWYGAPEGKPKGKVPAMVLVHGGGGTAFDRWVRVWTSRGYAAIAMDTCGGLPRGGNGKWEHDEQGGPSGWGDFEHIDEPLEDQWTYHAVADAILAHSLIRSFPEVDADRIGVTGISWGGYLTCILAGVDSRFKLAAPVYGCGFLGDDSAWLDNFARMGPEKAQKWLSLWDPSVYLPNAKMPMLWVTGTNDFAYPFDSLQKSYRLPKGERTLAIRLRMAHGHGSAGEGPEEIATFADSILKEGVPLAKIVKQAREDNTAWIKYHTERRITGAEILYTKDTGKWQERLWEAAPASMTGRRNAVGELPAGTTAYFINLIDGKGRVVSSEHEEIVNDTTPR